jgi:protein FAM50
MTDIKRIGDAGIHTVEGNLAGTRAARLDKKRQSEQAQYEEVKNKIKLQNSVSIGRIDDKFNSGADTLEQEFRKRTVGLVSAEGM